MGAIESFGGSSGDLEETALRHIGELIREVQPNSMVQRFVLVVETIDEDDRWLSAFTSPGLKRWDSIGMLDYAASLERNNLIARDDDDDE